MKLESQFIVGQISMVLEIPAEVFYHKIVKRGKHVETPAVERARG